MANTNATNTVFSGIAKVTEKANLLGPNVIRLEVGDVDLATSPLIKRGLIEAVEFDITHYPPLKGDRDLIKHICRELREKDRLMLDEEQILITPGGSMGIFLILLSMINPGDEIIVIEPIWPHFIQMISLVGGVAVIVPASAGGFHIDSRKIEEAITPKTKAMLLNTPNNPTGTIYSTEELHSVCLLAEKNDLIIISDEEYCNFIFGNNSFVSPATLYEKAFISRSFSKTYSASGLRLGFIVAPINDMDTLVKCSLFTTMYPASNIQHAVSYAMRLNDKYPETLCNEYSSRMSFVVDKVNRVDGLSAYPSEGGVYVWIKFEKDSDDVKMCNFILDKALISMVPGSYFGESGRGYARLSLGQCKERLAEAMDRLSEVMRVVKQ